MLKQSASQTIGPFFHIQLAKAGQNNLIKTGTLGKRIHLVGTVYDGDGVMVPDAMIEIWQADGQGIYDSENDPRRDQCDPNFRGYGCSATQTGEFSFRTVKPGIVPFDKSTNQAPHVLVRVFMRGTLLHAVTRLYFSDEPEANAADPLLNRLDDAQRPRLIAQREDLEATPTYRFDIKMQGDNATIFFEP
ncbi:MAG: protocatechuate 3,4-dioxygenase alpha subunit [Cellvibrionaceae bacterium]|jgi:protocatechuate 3,4-dioxygenase alpha subunit